METLVSTLKTLNAIYGKGNVSNVRLYLSGKGTFDQTPYGCRSRQLTFRIYQSTQLKTITVFALGHQKTFVY